MCQGKTVLGDLSWGKSEMIEELAHDSEDKHIINNAELI